MAEYRIDREQLEKLAEAIKAAVVVALGEAGLIEKDAAVTWFDSHAIAFEPDDTLEILDDGVSEELESVGATKEAVVIRVVKTTR